MESNEKEKESLDLENQEDSSVSLEEDVEEEEQNLFTPTKSIHEKTPEEIREDEIELRLQELEILMDQLEQKVLENPDTDEYDEPYLKAKEESKELLKERKELHKKQKSEDKSGLNQLSIWIVFYGIIMILICLPIISYNVWLDFANIVISALQNSFSNMTADTVFYNVVIFLVIFSLPLILLLVSWLLFVNVIKKKIDRNVFLGIWITQGILTIGMIIYMSIYLYR